MSIDLTALIQTKVGSVLSGYLTSQLGESHAVASKAIGLALPALLGKLEMQAGDKDKAGQLFQLVTGPQIDSTITAVQPSLLEFGDQLLASMLGDTSILVNLLAGKSGMSTGNIGHLLSAAFPLLLGVLRAHIQTNGMTQPQFAQLLFAQRGHVERALGSDLLGMLGLGAAVAATAPATDAAMATAVPAPVSAAQAHSGGWMKWLWLAVAALAALLLLRVYGPKPADTSMPPAAASAASAAGLSASSAASAP